MRLAPRPIDIDKAEGFTEENDTFGARQSAERFADLVSDLEGHSVIVVDGDWGSGKSTFVKQWAGMLRDRDHIVVEFDAFEADHHEDAFFSLLTTLLEEIEEASPSRGSLVAKLRQAAIGVGRTTPGILAQGVLPGPLGAILAEGFKFKHAMEQLGGSADVAMDQSLRERLALVEGERKAIKAFREELSSLARRVSGSNPPTGPLVFIIDELDRCKPSFALNVLERMKHVFAADGVCFVLVTHLSELTRMVRHAYGVEAPEEYLHKFYQLKIDIRELLHREGSEVKREYVRYLCAEFGLPTPDRDHTWFIAMTSLVRLYGLTLRSVERVVRNLAMYARTNRNYAVVKLMDIAAGLCVMREVNSDLYKRASEGRLTTRHATEFLQLGEWDILTREEVTKVWKQVTRETSLEEVPESVEILSTRDGGKQAVSMSEVVKGVCEDIDLFAQSG